MPTHFAVRCKTGGCGKWLQVEEIADDTPRAITVLLRTHEFSAKLTCLDCGKEHEYSHEDLEKVRAETGD
jgi:hypothetical protein